MVYYNTKAIKMDHRKYPNILFVFSDQHRWCDLGCYGNKQVRSPNLDAFAQRAVVFTNCIANCPVCVPMRASMLTGVHPVKHRAAANDLPMKHGIPTIGDVLSAAGYHTGYIGKWHLAGVPREQFIPAGPGRFGFQEWKVCNCNHDYMHAYYYDEENRRIAIDGYEPIEQTRLAVDFIHRNAGKPWGLILSWGPPHDPYRLVPENYLKPYDNMEIYLRPNVPDQVMLTFKRMLTQKDIIQCLRGYYAHITALDEQFGRLIAALEATGQMENTIILYTSDHGDMLGSQGFMNKQFPYEESIKVPLLVYWKGRTVHTVSEELIGLVDLPVSLLGLAGLRFPGEVDGQDLHTLFIDKEAKGLDACYIYDLIPAHQSPMRGGREWRGLRTRRYTFARSALNEGDVLYDNIADPYQLRNLVNEPAAAPIKRELLESLDSFIAKHDALLPWDEFVRQFGFKEAWNKSQAYFNLPLLE